MKCPSCDEKITDGSWMCPLCEHIVDASFLGNDITNEAGWADGLEEMSTFDSQIPKVAKPARKPMTQDLEVPEPPTDGLDVDQKMIVAAYEEDLDEVDEADVYEVPELAVKEVRSLGVPKHPDDKIDTKPLSGGELSNSIKPLDPSLLQEIPMAQPAPLVIEPKKRGLPALKKNDPSDDSDQKKRDVLQRAMARGPAQERRRSVADEKQPVIEPSPTPPTPPKQSYVPTSTPAVPPRMEPKSREIPVVVRNSKAEKIFQQALEDVAAGNLLSARTNVKLALSFDPGNERYTAKLAEVEAEVGTSHSQDLLEEVPKGAQHAKQFYEKALEQENQGNFDEAIKLLDKAVRADPQGVYYHRLGMILAFNQGKLKEGRTMVDKAIQRSPRNKNYQKTLGRILDKMNGGEEKRNMADLLGGLLKAKRKN